MSMLRVCSEPGCTTLTLGRLCMEHEPVQSLPPAETTEEPAEQQVEETEQVPTPR
jgi:hypothetical protein